MAIDSLAKRASVASLALAFLGPSVVPSGTIDASERLVIGHSYYGISAGSSFVTIGDTSQLEVFSSTGGITLERVIGGASQLEAFDSTGGITLERVIGGTSQLDAFSSTGGITVGDAASGGGISKRKRQEEYDQAFNRALKKKRLALTEAIELQRHAETLQRKPRKKLKLAAKKAETSIEEVKQLAVIQDKVNRELAIEFEIRRLVAFKRRENELLSILLLMS